MRKNKEMLLNKKHIFILLFGLISILFSIEKGFSQTNSQFRTPAVMAPGKPAGSYSLNDLETINLYNGNLNFNLPLLMIGGRGNAGYTMSLPIEHRWQVNRDDSTPGYTFYNPVYEWWTGEKPGYSPGIVRVRQTMGECQSFGQSIETNSNLTFTATNGTEIELKDTIAYSEPLISNCSTTNGASRGTTFVSKDGSHMTFISDTVIYDRINTSSLFLYPSGNLMFKDGTIYRIDNGAVSWIRDRNGNKTTFSYNNSQLPFSMTATDSLNRQVIVEYNVNDGAPYGICDRITFKGVGGSTRIIRISKTNLSAALKPGETLRTWSQLFPNMSQSGTQFDTYNLISSVWLPDGRRYQFFYNAYADLAKVILPTGGAVEYDWWGNDEHNAIYRRISERRSYPDGVTLESKTTYDSPNFSAPTSPIVERQVSANGTQLSVNKHYFYGNAWIESVPPGPYSPPVGTWQSGREYKTEAYSSDGTTLLQETTQTWYQDPVTWWSQTTPSNNPRIIESTLKLADTNQVSKKTFTYDQFNNITDTYEYDYGGNGSGQPGTFNRRTHTDYITYANYTSHTGAHLRNLPFQTWVSSDTNGMTKASLTQFEYDNYTGGNNASLFPRTNTFGHDTSNYGTNRTVRGNVTKITTFGNAQNQSEAINVFSNYDILGNTVRTIDAKENISTIDYADRFGAPDGEAQTNTPPTQLNGQSTFAFPTSATNTLGWIMGYSQVDYFTGQSVDVEDLNGVVNSTFYNDELDRPTQSITANNIPTFSHQTNIIYDDANRRIETKADLNAFNDNLLKSESFYDGLGRTVESRKYESDGDYVATKSVPFVMIQDPETSVWRIGTQTSNPYRPLRGEQPVWTTALSDSLGRGIKAITLDGAVVKTEYSGNTVTVTDQAGKKRRSITNALGQLVRVDEPDVNNGNQLGTIDAPLQPTYYEYDTLSNLTKVKQGGTFESPVQTRTFAYDSLSRLKQATNPESGTISYVYDENGNLTKKTDARLIETNYVYDNLNRVITRSYDNEPNTQRATPSVTYTYEDASITTLKGMLTKVSSDFSTTAYTEFDLLGRVKKSQQTTDGTVYNPMEYSYNLSGALIEQKYPSGRVVKNTLDNDGDLALVQSRRDQNAGLVAYAKHFSYTAAGAVSSMQLGNGAWESTVFNSRLQPTQIALGSVQNGTNKLKLDFTYNTTTNGTPNADNNGNVLTQTITTPSETRGSTTYNAFTAVQTYQYDALNRIKEAEEKIGSSQQWKQTFVYDRYGNRTFDEGSVGGHYKTTTLPRNCGTAPNLVCAKDNPQAIAANNKLQGIEYDSAGNTRTDLDNRRFTYDGENKQIKVETTDGNGDVTGTLGEYFYDGDGKRVKKVSLENGQWITTIFVYDASGKMVAEYSTQLSPTPQVSYLTTDHLGSPRVNTDAIGNVTARHDYQPFGEEVQRASHGTDQVRKKFTGYQRDSETNLDFAKVRYHSSSLGRFNSPDSYDPATFNMQGKTLIKYLIQPQNWNKYAYTRNNPLNYIDLSGHNPVGAAIVLYIKSRATEAGIRAVAGAVINGGAEFVKQSISDKEYNWRKVGSAAAGGAAGGIVEGLLPPGFGGIQGSIGSTVTGIVDRSLDGDDSTEALDPTSMADDAASGFIADQLARPISRFTKRLSAKSINNAKNEFTRYVNSGGDVLKDYAIKEGQQQYNRAVRSIKFFEQIINKGSKKPIKEKWKNPRPVNSGNKNCPQGPNQCTEVTVQVLDN